MNRLPLSMLLEELFAQAGCKDCPCEIVIEKSYKSDDRSHYKVTRNHEDTCPDYRAKVT